MSYQLKLDEMLDVFHALEDRETFKLFQGKLEALGDEMAAVIGAKLNVQVGATSWDMGMTACPFYPAFKGQELPKAMEDLDDEGDWEDDFDTAPDLPEGFKDWPFPEADVLPNDLLEVLMPDGRSATGTAVEAIRIPGIRAWRKVEGPANG